MDIVPLGHAAFLFKGKTASVVTDPYDPQMVGLTFPKKISAHIVTISHAHPDHNFAKIVEDPQGEEKIILSGPGEYEVKGIDIVGIPTFHDNKNGSERGNNTIYKIEIDGISIVHCGDVGHKLSEAQIDQLDGVDVLLIPVGGLYTIDAKEAAEIVTELEPSIIIPMHYGREELNPKIFKDLSPLALFLKEIGKEGVIPQSRLKVTRDTLLPETQVVVLE